MCMHVYTHSTHVAHTHALKHKHMHCTCTHTCTQAQTHALHMHTHMYSCTNTCIAHAHTHVLMHKHMHCTCTHTCTHAQTHALHMHTHMHACMHTYTHTHNTHAHTHVHICIHLQELKTGLSENSVFSVFHPDASDLFSVCSSLDKVHTTVSLVTTVAIELLIFPQVCSDLRDPSTHLNETSITYFTPFRPMLGQRATMDQVCIPPPPPQAAVKTRWAIASFLSHQAFIACSRKA